MVWAILAAVGVPLWLCAAGILALIFRNRALRTRPGNVPVRVRGAGKKRWSPGHGVWIPDVFAFRGLPAGWKESLVWVTDAAVRPATEEERKKLHRIGEEPVVVTLKPAGAETIEVAARLEHAADLMGPFASASSGAPASATRALSPSQADAAPASGPLEPAKARRDGAVGREERTRAPSASG